MTDEDEQFIDWGAINLSTLNILHLLLLLLFSYFPKLKDFSVYNQRYYSIQSLHLILGCLVVLFLSGQLSQTFLTNLVINLVYQDGCSESLNTLTLNQSISCIRSIISGYMFIEYLHSLLHFLRFHFSDLCLSFVLLLLHMSVQASLFFYVFMFLFPNLKIYSSRYHH